MKIYWAARCAITAVFATLVAGPGPVGAQPTPFPIPQKALTIVVPYPAGGANDNTARLLSKRLAESLGRAVIVENRPGASGMMGAEYVARAAPDGHTLLYTSSSLLTAAVLQPKSSYDPLKSFVPVSRVCRVQFVVAVANQLPVKSLEDFIAYAKRQPRKVTFGTSGIGSINQFATVALADAAGIELTHVPYRGMAPAMQDLAGGHLDLVIGSLPSTMVQVKSGRARALALTGGAMVAQLPGVATAAAVGIPGFSFEAWIGLLAPAGTPLEIVDRLSSEVARALQDAALRAALEAEGGTPAATSSAEFGGILLADMQRFRQLAQKNGIKAE